MAVMPARIYAQSDWLEKDSENFKLIYKPAQSHLADHILSSAEVVLRKMEDILGIIPSEKIIINTYDVSDYGFASATSVPQNFIRIEIEPFEPGYENIPYNERFRWVLSHELVHILINDQASGLEKFFRAVFSKVAPDKNQPLTILFSYLTNFVRYSPRWHQEAIATFLETWLNGGYGRALGNFDEMYFRSLVYENKRFFNRTEIEAKESHNSFLLETLLYFYGTRFASHLAIAHGADKLLEWYKVLPGDGYSSICGKFKEVFGIDLDEAWDAFIINERYFQNVNLNTLKSSPLTVIHKLSGEPTGWVTQPYFDPERNEIIFGYHKPHTLAAVEAYNINDWKPEYLTTFKTPSMSQVGSITYDKNLKLLFFTTNNNKLFRDIWMMDRNTLEKRILFQDFRIGQLSVSSYNHELWGIMHSEGSASLVYSPYPYTDLIKTFDFDVSDEIMQIAISPTGKYLAIVMHRSDGTQSLITVDCSRLKKGQPFEFSLVSDKGSPENPSWSSEENYLYWNAYTNGVSNIYKKDLANNSLIPVTHTLRGLFKPIYINKDSLFAFEFTSEGFIPVLIPNAKADKLPAIKYLGQRIIAKNPQVISWYVDPRNADIENIRSAHSDSYNGFSNLFVQTFIPTITGFQKQKAFGFYTQITDPILNHDLKFEFAYSVFDLIPGAPKFHLKGEYEYKKTWKIAADYNAPDFFDLVNKRKRGMIGTKFKLGHKAYWIYDNPHKLIQQSELALYTGVEFINDNLVKVSEPDFMVAQTEIKSQNLRRTIGSSDEESGDEFTLTIRMFGSDPKDLQYSGQIYAEWDKYSLWAADHNVIHLKLASGYHHDNPKLFQSRFFFGGFGNRKMDNEENRQFRKVLRFPGIPIYSMDTDKFLKLMLENAFPPLRFGNANIGSHLLNHIDFAIYSQFLVADSPVSSWWVDLGAQLDFTFKHWFNLESTFSTGLANSWYKGSSNFEWFFSVKLLKN